MGGVPLDCHETFDGGLGFLGGGLHDGETDPNLIHLKVQKKGTSLCISSHHRWLVILLIEKILRQLICMKYIYIYIYMCVYMYV